MFEWSFASSTAILLVITALNLLLGLLRKSANLGLISMGVVEFVALFNLVLTFFALNSGKTARTSTVEYFFYAVVALLVPLAGITWTLIQRNSFALYVYATASFTLLVMVYRMHQIWFGV